jgi:aminoglycoside phosphotransferase (APT) family kinase protein
MDKNYKSFLIKKHSAFKTPDKVIDSVVKKSSGSVPVSKKRLIAGEVNEVYDIKTQDGRELIVRISHGSNSDFEQEQWAIKRCRQIGVPVPEILSLESLSVNEKPLSILIERKISGESLNILQNRSSKGLERIVNEAGKILAKIHIVSTKKFGKINKNGEGKYQTLADSILKVRNIKKKLLGIAQKVDLKTKFITGAIDIIENNQRLYKETTPHLVHGDFTPDHILVKAGRVVGILDFENCRSGDSVADFAWWDFFWGKRLPTDWLKKGYQKVGKLGQNYETKLHLHRLSARLWLLDYYYDTSNKIGISEVKRSFEKDLKYFEK